MDEEKQDQEELARDVMEVAERFTPTVQKLIEGDALMQRGLGMFLEGFPPALRPNVLMFAQIFGALLMRAAINFKASAESTQKERTAEDENLDKLLHDVDLSGAEDLGGKDDKPTTGADAGDA